MRRIVPRALSLLAVAALGVAVAPGCSLGSGKGDVTGTLDIPDCWQGNFDLHPDFFAAIPYRQTSLILRIQNGGDYETFSDGVTILVDDVGLIRGDGGGASLLGQELEVALPPEVTPPGVPVKPIPDPARVHFALYLQRTCRVQTDALYAMDEVSGVGPDGECGGASGDASAGTSPTLAQQCGALGVLPGDGGAGDGGVPGGEAGAPDAGAPPPVTSPNPHPSFVRFTKLSNANPDETDADSRLNEGEFDVYLADPRDICPGGLGPPPPCRGHVKGTFKFYFQRGRPAQPFP